MSGAAAEFRKPSRPEHIFNRLFGVLVRFGLAPRYNYLVSSRRRFRIRPVSGDEKLAILKAYLDRYELAVQRYFPVRAGSEPGAFRDIADRYPVFELLAADDAPPH